MKTRVLVTGATGFVGRRTLEALTACEDVEVVAACRDPGRLATGFRGEVRVGDMLDPAVPADLVRGVDVVCNAYAPPSGDTRRRIADAFAIRSCA